MPVDADGNRAHFISGVDSVPGRMNLARLFIPYVAGCARDVRRTMLEQLGMSRYFDGKLSIEELTSIPADRLNAAVATMLDFYKIASKRSYTEYTEHLTNDERYLWLLRVVNTFLYVYAPIDEEGDRETMVLELEKRFKPTYGPVTYKASDGSFVTTKNSFRVAPIPMMLLNKIADTWLSADIGRLSNFGILTAMNEADKHSRPWRKTPTRVFGETESRLYACYGGSEMIAELLDRSGNIVAQREIAEQLLTAPNPADIDRIIDREKIPFGNSRPLQITNSFLKCVGVEIVHEEEDLGSNPG